MFESDSLSPLLFCASLIPGTEGLTNFDTGLNEHKTKTNIKLLLYVEDLKLVEKGGRTSENMQKLGNVSDDTKMNYVLYKYAKRRKLVDCAKLNT